MQFLKLEYRLHQLGVAGLMDIPGIRIEPRFKGTDRQPSLRAFAEIVSELTGVHHG